MSEDTPQEGGPEWERNQAAAQIAAALLAHDADALVIGADRLGDAVTNAATARLIPTLKHTLESVVAKQIGALAEQMDARESAVFEWRVETRERTDRRFDTFGAELDNGFAEVRGLRGDFAALQAGFHEIRDQLAQLKEDNFSLHEGQAQLRKDHIDFRGNQESFRVAQDLLVGKVSDLGENFDTLQQIFDLMKDEGERRWAHATAALSEQTQEMAEQRVIIERKEQQIKHLIDQVQALRSELEQVRAQTIADELSADERRTLTETTRWMAEHRDQIVLKDDAGDGTRT